MGTCCPALLCSSVRVPTLARNMLDTLVCALTGVPLLLQVPVEDELAADFSSLAPARPLYEAPHRAPKQAAARAAAAGDLPALLAELRCAAGGLASERLRVLEAGRKQAPAQHAAAPQDDQLQQGGADGPDAAAAQGEAPQLPGDTQQEGVTEAEWDAASVAADQTARLAYILLGEGCT